MEEDQITGYIAHTSEIRNAHKTSVGKFEWKRPLQEPILLKRMLKK
jgi:hypothetical protein